MMTDEKTRPAVYCGTYGKYNDGSIAGKWLYLEDYETADDFWQACKELHKDENDPEFMFQDFEGFPRDLYSESMSDADLAPILAWVHLDEDTREIVEEYLDATGYSFDPDDVDDIVEQYEGNLDDIRHEYGNPFMSNEAAYGNYMHDIGNVEIPEHLEGYVDWEAIGRDYMQDVSVSKNGFIFRDR